MNCELSYCGLKMEPHPGLDSVPARHHVQPGHQPRPLAAEVSVPPPDVRAHPCSTNKVSTHRGRPAQCPAETGSIPPGTLEADYSAVE